MLEKHNSLAMSSSFSGCSSAPVVEERHQKRSISSELTFFTPAATSFKPRPYLRNESVARKPKTSPVSHHLRSFEAVPNSIMDPSPEDTDAVFIHPPFTSFPDAHSIPEGLTYSLMAANPNWFLDAYDFISANNTNPLAIAYPPHLEPPRGWCPSKKKELKHRGTRGWPEGEEPRLRCTFCRRTYAGVNAKSMWRRHVFEKHKIGMANRRDGHDRPRGRGSKENRSFTLARKPPVNDGDIDETSQDPELLTTLPLASKFSLHTNEYAKPDRPRRSRSGGLKQRDNHSPPPPLNQEHPSPIDDNLSQPYSATQRAHSPVGCPATPPLCYASDNSDKADGSLESFLWGTPPILPSSIMPQSPYDPLLTPSFRHSPPRLPSDQPWRFPSPSHPLYSKGHDFCLTMLAPSTISPVIKCDTQANPSPIQAATPQGPFTTVFSKDYIVSTNTSASKTLASSLFSTCDSATGIINNEGGHDLSPPGRSSKSITTRLNNYRMRDEGSGWQSDSTGMRNQPLPHDPFDIYNSWLDTNTNGGENAEENCGPPLYSLDGASPVVRTLSGRLSDEIQELCNFSLIYPPLSDEGEDATVEASFFSSDGTRDGKRDIEMSPTARKRRRTFNGVD